MNLSYYKKINSSISIDLSMVDLSCADLSHAILSDANLSDADLSYADLSHADLSHADLSHANLFDANLNNTILDNTDLRHFSSKIETFNINWKTIFRKIKKSSGAKITITDFDRQIYPSWRHTNKYERENPTDPERKEAMQTFCNETGMIIFDDDDKENIVAEPEPEPES